MQNRKINLRTNTDIRIPARSEQLITTTPAVKLNNVGCFITEPESCEINGLLVANSIHELWGKEQAVLRIMNLNDHEIILKENVEVFSISEVNCKDLVTGTKDGFAKDHTRLAKLKSEVKIGRVPGEIHKRVEQFIERNQDVLALDGDELGRTDTVEYDINTGDAAPVAAQKYRTPYFLRDEMKRIISKNIENGLIEPCSSQWAAPCLLVQKTNGTYRLVCDYRKLNLKTVSDNYPLPVIKDLLNELHGSIVFSSCDLFSGVHQIPVSENTKENRDMHRPRAVPLESDANGR